MSFLKNIIKSIAKFVVYTLAFCILCVISFILYVNWQAYKPLTTKKLNSEQWKLAEIETNSIGYPDLKRRCGMYRDLTKNHLRKGMFITEVEGLLGPINSWNYCKNKKIKCHDYVMGICYSSGIFVVHNSLFVCFNDKQKLVTFDNDEHCETLGRYDLGTKEQSCFKYDSDGFGTASNNCGIEPW